MPLNFKFSSTQCLVAYPDVCTNPGFTVFIHSVFRKHFGTGQFGTLDSRRSSGDGASGEPNGKLMVSIYTHNSHTDNSITTVTQHYHNSLPTVWLQYHNSLTTVSYSLTIASQPSHYSTTTACPSTFLHHLYIKCTHMSSQHHTVASSSKPDRVFPAAIPNYQLDSHRYHNKAFLILHCHHFYQTLQLPCCCVIRIVSSAAIFRVHWKLLSEKS